MKKTLFLLTIVTALSLSAVVSNKDFEVSQQEIEQYSKHLVPSEKPLQTDCCYPNDKTSTAVGHGARCTTGSQYCVANGCPSGTGECGTNQ